jgi:hypothetical protein
MRSGSTMRSGLGIRDIIKQAAREVNMGSDPILTVPVI